MWFELRSCFQASLGAYKLFYDALERGIAGVVKINSYGEIERVWTHLGRKIWVVRHPDGIFLRGQHEFAGIL